MDYDQEKVDEVALALLFLTFGSDNRAWKGMAREVSDRLYKKGWIEDPHNKNKSFELTAAGREACIGYFQKHFETASLDDKPEATLLSLPVDIDMLVFAFYRDESASRQPFLDAATGLIKWSNDNSEPESPLMTIEELSNNPRYLSIPICALEERSRNEQWSDKNRKRVRKHIKQWLESQPIFRL